MASSTIVKELPAALTRVKGATALLFGLSSILNLLTLGGSIYMMLVYDSVLPSQSVPTLLSLFALLVVVYLFQGTFELLRNAVLATVSAAFHEAVAPRVQQAIAFIAVGRLQADGDDGITPMRDLDTIRQFLSGPGPSAIMDFPWVVLFIVILSMLHIWLGIVTLVGALIMVGLTIAVGRVSDMPAKTVSATAGRRYAMADEMRRHIDTIMAMGMTRRLNTRWSAVNVNFIQAQQNLANSSGFLSILGKMFRSLLQSGVLTVGAFLVIEGKMSAGVIFASSIMSSRALMPIDIIIGQWKTIAGTQLAWKRLQGVLLQVPRERNLEILLPAPRERLHVEGLVGTAPGSQQIIIQGVSFSLRAGEALGVIGPSAAGKSSLVRLLLGIWPAMRGNVRLDEADIDHWDRERLGRHLGYLSQTVELMSGTVGANIGRFSMPPDSDKVIAAAKAAGVHEMIARLPQGYDTLVGVDGFRLSAGQQQRVALARALFDDPFMVILDEPNSNLDAEGEAALSAAILRVRARGGIAIVVAHRPSALSPLSHLLVMRDGRMDAFGERDEILNRLKLASPLPAQQHGEPGRTVRQ